MKFKVRPPFAVHHEKVVESEEAGRKVKQPVVESHFAGEIIELAEKDARKHLHKLEPLDDEAKALMEDCYEQNRQVAAARGGAPAIDIEAMINKKVEEIIAARFADAQKAAGASAGAKK